MKTITFSIDESVLLRAEQKAAELETSVSDVVADYLRKWANGDAIEAARCIMTKRFAQPDWQFAVGKPDDREQRNART